MTTCILLLALIGFDEEKGSKIIKPADAKAHVDQKVTMEMTVNSASYLERSNMVFLNSEKNHRDEKNFTVVIFKDGLERFQEMKIEAPAKHYLKKTVRVRGKIALRDGKPQMRLVDPGDIKIVEEKPETEKKTEKPAATSDKAA